MTSRRLVILLLSAVACCRTATATPPPARPQPVTVVMVDNRFIPDRIEFQAGVRYRLRLENKGKDLHEFTAPEFFAAAKVTNRRLLANGGKEVVVQPQQTVVVDLVPMKPGEFNLICADHDWDGMVGKIVVR
jgi:plastocyanin